MRSGHSAQVRFAITPSLCTADIPGKAKGNHRARRTGSSIYGRCAANRPISAPVVRSASSPVLLGAAKLGGHAKAVNGASLEPASAPFAYASIGGADPRPNHYVAQPLVNMNKAEPRPVDDAAVIPKGLNVPPRTEHRVCITRRKGNYWNTHGCGLGRYGQATPVTVASRPQSAPFSRQSYVDLQSAGPGGNVRLMKRPQSAACVAGERSIRVFGFHPWAEGNSAAPGPGTAMR